MFFSFLRSRRALFTAIELSVCLAGCSRPAATNSQPERLAILRFENLSGDPSVDWMGRAFSEILIAEMRQAPDTIVLTASALHSMDPNLGARPLSAPGISAERTPALLQGATRIVYGDYTVRGGRLEARISVEDQRTGKVVRSVSAAAPENDVVGAASELARALWDHAPGYATRNQTAVKAFSTALELKDPAARLQTVSHAIAADPDFGPAYRMLAEVKAQQQDRDGAMAALRDGLARGNAISASERARMELDVARLRDDAAARQQALEALVKADPSDPGAWRSLAESSFGRHDYNGAVAAYRKVLQFEPNDLNSLNLLGYSAAYAGDLKSATEALQRYRSLRPKDPNPLDSLGDVNLISGRLAEAESLYLQAQKMDPAFLSGGDLYKAAMAHLMTGDVAGADALAKAFIQGRGAADAMAPYRKAQWDWVAGRRKQAVAELTAFAEATQGGTLREAASRAYSELGLWNLLLGDRSGAAQLAAKAVSLSGPASAGNAVITRFLAQPQASAAEWAARADQLFRTAPAGSTIKDVALSYALLLNQEFAAAAPVLQRLYNMPAAAGEEALPFLLAWTDVETGHEAEAAPLLRPNPIPQTTGISPFIGLYFPRIYELRARVAEKQGDAAQAQANRQLFQKLTSGGK